MTSRSSNVLWPEMIVKSSAHRLDILRRLTRPSSFALGLLSLLLSAPFAMAGTSGNGLLNGGTDHYYCSSDMGQPTIYFSAAFEFSWPRGTVRVQDSVIGNEFKQTLVTKYAYAGNVVCFGTPSLAQTQTEEQSRITNMRASKKWKVVETGWKYHAAAGGGAASESDQSHAQKEASGSADNSPSQDLAGGLGSGSAQAASAETNSGGQAENPPAAK